MSLGPGLYGQASFKIMNDDKKFATTDLAALKRFDVPNYDPTFPADPGNLAFDGAFIKYYNGSAWITLSAGGAIQNAPDTDPNPDPNYLVNPALEIRNIKSIGNGLTLNTSSNSLVLNYQPSFVNPPATPHVKLWNNGKYTNISSTTLTISQDVDGNYFLESNATPISNAPDPVPGAIFLLDGNSLIKNLRTAGNGITITSNSTSAVINYEPSFKPAPIHPSIKLWDNGSFPYVYSNSLAISLDLNGNYSIESSSAPSPFPAENCFNDLSLGAAEIVEPINGKLRLLNPLEGISITQASPNNNYISFMGYDTKNATQTVGSTTFDFVYPLALSEAFYYVFTIKGVNVTDSKVYFFEIRRTISNFSGFVTSGTPANTFDTAGDLVSIPQFQSAMGSFSIRVQGLTGKTINWTIYTRRV